MGVQGLNPYKYIDFLEGSNDEIVAQIQQITLPFKIVSWYYDGSKKKNVCVINLYRPIRKKIIREKSNGRSKE